MEQVGSRAVIHPVGTMLDAVRMRTHSPPPAGWEWNPDVVMGDGATAADLAIAKVFSDGQPLPDILGAEGALREFSTRTLLPLCSCGATYSVRLRWRVNALRNLAQVLKLLRRLLLQLTWNGVVSPCQMIRLLIGLTRSLFASTWSGACTLRRSTRGLTVVVVAKWLLSACHQQLFVNWIKIDPIHILMSMSSRSPSTKSSPRLSVPYSPARIMCFHQLCPTLNLPHPSLMMWLPPPPSSPHAHHPTSSLRSQVVFGHNVAGDITRVQNDHLPAASFKGVFCVMLALSP